MIWNFFFQSIDIKIYKKIKIIYIILETKPKSIKNISIYFNQYWYKFLKFYSVYLIKGSQLF